MVRSFIYLLVLIVVFLSGMLIGMDRERLAISNNHEQPEEMISLPAQLSASKDNEPIQSVEHIEASQTRMDIEKPPHFTQKIASLLETGVKGFYEVIVEILYQISRLFV